MQRTIDGVMARLAFSEADDLVAERDAADAALKRLGEALRALEATGAEVEAKLGALGEEDAAGDLGSDLRRTLEEVRAKVDLGRRVHATAAAAAFRLACSVPVRKLLRKRPRDVTGGIEGALDAEEATEMLHGAFREIEAAPRRSRAREGRARRGRGAAAARGERARRGEP